MDLKVSVFIATSLDGFIAREDGGIDWLEAANAAVPPGEDCGYARFIASVDALVMGSGTFEKVLSFPDWPYGDKPVWVLSHSLARLPDHLPPSVQLLRDAPGEVVARARRQGYQRLYVDGGKLVQSFLREGLVTDLTLTTIPVLLGAGRPLFGPLRGDIRLGLESSHGFAFGFVQSIYRVEPATAPA